MKTRYVVLVFLSLILFTNISCEEDENNNENDEQVAFTATNYIYEGDLRAYYLETKNTELEAQIAIWQQVPDSDPAYNDAQASIAEANAEIANNEEEASSIVSPSNAFFIINPTFPPLPPPLPCLCLDVFNSIDYIVFQSGNDQGSITITSVTDQSILVNTNPNSTTGTIPNTNDLGSYQSLEFSQYEFTGEAIITVQTDTGSYSILSYFQNP
ncbi:hypothetical protein KO494_07730 [Lacinutrix sp. C3R15]|uniref:hypothetical protein n=1 Tax=Flavobacteriaceae TaxID=49546 RepID=UPI001C07FFC5|nr:MULTISPECIES: hypothetical protein [Flavobacteriaceae]MBU2939428.1 hypothetical protein [Lacinutrix sp. C3R15]MDO6622743.1 hypothetical protein [Oceanihabitans sp. 1_MG-2023]